MRNWIAALLLCWAGSALSASVNWSAAVKTVTADPLFRDLPVQVRYLKVKQADSPMTMRLTGKECILLVKQAGNKQADAMLEEVPAEIRQVFVETIVAHELSHCWRQQNNPERFEQLDALSTQPSRTMETDMYLLESLRAEEMFADVAALAWVEARRPEVFQQVLEAFLELRHNPRFASDVHDTRAALVRIRRHGMLYGETPFDAAEATLSVVLAKPSVTATRRVRRVQ